jgi:hypothetical protein
MSENKTDENPEMAEKDVPHLEMVETGLPGKWVALVSGIVVAFCGLWLVYVSLFTDLPRQWLPHTHELALLVVPQGTDGSEPLDLLELTHAAEEKQFVIEGKVRNRTSNMLEGVVVIIKIGYLQLVNAVETEVPVQPPALDPSAEGAFRLVHPLQGTVTGYSIAFRLPNGAMLPHKDSRTLPGNQ